MWRAWTNARALDQWYSPVALSVLRSVVSGVGGWWTVGVDVPENGFVAYFYGKYTEFTEHVRSPHDVLHPDAAELAARED